jgi:hypothetical protein
MTPNNEEVNYGVSHGLSRLVSDKQERIIDIINDSNDYHPNIEGHKTIAIEIYNKIKNI